MTTTSLPGAVRRPARPRPTRSERFETAVLVLILLTVGGFAGAASFTHVHDWTMHNSPTGTGDWFGWANAAVSELVPIAALLVMRRRRRTGQPVAYPASLLVAALALSVTAQLAVAKPGFFGGLVSVVPALAFAALAKLVLGKNPPTPTADEPASSPAEPRVVVDDRPAVPKIVPGVPAQATVPVSVSAPPATTPVPRPVSTPSPASGDRPGPSPTPRPVPAVPATPAATATATAPTDASTDTQEPGWPVPPLPPELLGTARDAAEAHLAEHGRPISRDDLQKILRVSNATTGEVMRALNLRTPPAVQRVNGSPVTA